MSNPEWTTPRLRVRLACMLYEGVLLFGVLMFFGMLFGILTQQRHALQGRTGFQWFLLLLLAAYFGWFWTHGGQTLAMKTWRIRLVRLDGQALDTSLALKRFALSWIWFAPALLLSWLLALSPQSTLVLLALGLVAYALTALKQKDQQFWHDVWAKTRLVQLPGKSV